MNSLDPKTIVNTINDITVSSNVLSGFIYDEQVTSAVSFWVREGETVFTLLSFTSADNQPPLETLEITDIPWYEDYKRSSSNFYMMSSNTPYGLRLIKSNSLLKNTRLCLDLPLKLNHLLLGFIRVEFEDMNVNLDEFLPSTLEISDVCAKSFYSNFRYQEIVLHRQAKMATQSRELQEKQDALSICTDALISVGFDHKIKRFTENAEKLFGYTADAVLGKDIKMLCPSIDKLLTLQDINTKEYTEVGCLREDGQGFIALVASIPARGSYEESRITGVTFLFKDITASKRAQARINQLQEEVNRDPLTGVYNRKYAEHWLSATSQKETPITIALLDIDNFKLINDTRGHPCGDYVLIELTKIIQDTLRNNDLLARYGGEEFIIGLPGCDLQSASKILERVRNNIAYYDFTYEETGFTVTASIGFDVCPCEKRIDDTIKRADIALYKAKSLSKNRIIYAGDTQIDMFHT